jgi:predicted TIM-barrel fold metal-dependent hydrolase
MSVLEGIPVIDAHHHFWELKRSYPWLEGPPNPERFTGDDSAIRVDYLPDDLRRDFAGIDLIGSVHIDAGAGDPGVEADWLQQVHGDDGLPTVIVAAADLSAPDAATHLERIAALPAVRGIRHILNWHEDPRFTYVERDDLMTDPVWLANFARLSALGLSFDLQVYPAQLEQAAEVARRHPDTLVILNHTGMPLHTDGDALAEWRSGIDLLAAEPNTAIKISGIGMTIHPWTTETIRPFVEHAIEAFTPERAMFGSNFPVDRLYSDISTLYGAFDTLTSDASDSERRDLFAGTAARLYRIDFQRKADI